MAPDDAADGRIRSGPNARHLLSTAAFDELAAGGGGPSTVAGLWRSELSRRLVLLRALHDLLGRDPDLLGPLPPLSDTWRALEEAQETAPKAVSELLLFPGVGAWLSYAFREHARRGAGASEAYGVFGQMHVVALVAAARAGRRFATRVPLRGGQVYLPLHGLARFDAVPAWGVADAATDGGRIWLEYAGRRIDVPPEEGVDADGWWSLRRLRTGGGAGLAVWLDDLDPMRDLADPVAPVRLSDAEVDRWQRLLDEAWATLTAQHADVAESMVGGVVSLVPLPMGPIGETRSASSGDAFGAVMCSPPPDAATLAVSLTHEYAHIRLGGLMHLLQLTEGGESASLYAPWRDDPRPLGGLLQGVYAFFAIAQFWRRQRSAVDPADAALAEFEYAYSRAQAAEGLATVRASGGLTAHGVAFVDRLDAELRSWDDTAVATEPVRLARLVADGHRAGWRIRHCTPTSADVATLVGRWCSGRSEKVHIGQSTVDPDPAMRQWSHGRLGLARRRILAPERVDTVGDSWGAHLTDADLTLFAGDGLAASKGFADQIGENPDALDAWTGLGLALASDGRSSAATALLERPEVVLAVYRGAAATGSHAPSPPELAAWLGETMHD